jgi:outer membrane protein OmpA-like peptidoglycan-associated protein
VQIVGHADPRKRQNGTNESLARERAEEVSKVVEAWVKAEAPQWAAMTIEVRSESARDQARDCKALSPDESEACHAFNRRVVLQLITAPSS